MEYATSVLPSQTSSLRSAPAAFRPTHALIDLAALQHNLQQARCAAPQQRLMAVIKANAYGHGCLPVAQALERGGADALAVACIEEALPLRAAHIRLPIVLLEGFFHADELPLIAQQHLQIVLHSPQQLEILQHSRLPRPISLWLKFDSGMHRLGFSAGELQTAWQRLKAMPEKVAQIGLLTHLACADERDNAATAQQCQRFYQTIQGWRAQCSLANSAGILGWQVSHADWGRPGIMLYGASPFAHSIGTAEGLKPVMQLRSALISIKHYQAGDALGYGATWQCPQNMPVGIVAIGYGDGYPRHAPSGTPLWLNGQRVPLVGRVSMDMLAVDLRQQPQARVGDRVELWGEHIAVDEVARQANTIAYELLCHVTQRVGRVYINGSSQH